MTRAQRLGLGLLLAVLAFNAARAVVLEDGGDFRYTYDFGSFLVERSDSYLSIHRTYPPFYAVVAAPFSLLPYSLARATWTLIDIACLVWILSILWRWIGQAFPRIVDQRFVVLTVAVLLTLRFILNNADNGQNNLILAAFSLAAIDAATRGRPVASGMLVGVATAIKVVPGLTLAYLLAKRQWRAVLAGSATVVACTALPVLWVGPDRLAVWLRQWVAVVSRIALEGNPRVGRLPDGTWINHSLKYTFLRYLREYDSARESALGSVDLPPALVVALFAVAAAGLLVTFLILSSRQPSLAVTPVLFLEVGLLFLLFPLLSPIAYKPHFVGMIVANTAIVALLFDCGTRRSPTRSLVLALFVGASLAGGLSGGLMTSKPVADWLGAYHAITFSALMLFLASALALLTLRSGSRQARAREPRRRRLYSASEAHPVRQGAARVMEPLPPALSRR